MVVTRADVVSFDSIVVRHRLSEPQQNNGRRRRHNLGFRGRLGRIANCHTWIFGRQVLCFVIVAVVSGFRSVVGVLCRGEPLELSLLSQSILAVVFLVTAMPRVVEKIRIGRAMIFLLKCMMCEYRPL